MLNPNIFNNLTFHKVILVRFHNRNKGILMSKKIASLFIVFIFMLMPLVSIQPVTAGTFSDIDFEQPHDNYTDTPPAYFVNTTPEQPWKKTDIDFTGSVGAANEYSIGFSKKINLDGQLPGDLAAVEGSVELGFKIGIRYDISFGYEFGVDYYSWANDLAVSEGEEFTYCSYVEPDPDTFSLWADISIEPFMELWADIDVYLELAGYEIVDWDKSWSLDLSLPISISPNLDLGALLEAGVITPIGALLSTPKFGLGLGIPGRLEYGIGDWAGVYFDAGCGAYVEFQIRGLLESLLELTGDANAKFDDDKSRLDLKYYDPGKENLKSINIHVPVGSAGKVVEILAHEFVYSIEPGILLSWDGFIDYGAYLHIPTPTKFIKVARTITEKVCDWLPWPAGKVCDKETKTVFDFVEVAATIVPDIDWDWGDRHEIEDELWIPFFNIPLLQSDSEAIDSITVLSATDHPLSIDHTWSNTWSDNWTLGLGPSALRLSAYAGYALDLLLEGMLYSYFKPNDQIAGHPFNYYVGVDGDEAGDGTFGGSVAAGYSLELKIPYMDELLGHDVWIELVGYDFNTSEFSNLDIPLFDIEYTVGYAAISLSGEAEFADLDDLEIVQSANGFVGDWETEPFFSIGMSLDGKIFEVISMNLGEVNVDFLFKGTGNLTGDISASGAGSFDSNQMHWDDAGDINYANIYPDPDAEKGDIIDILIQNLKYNLGLDLVIRVSAHLFASAGPLSFSHDFEIDLIDGLQANVTGDIQEEVPVTAGFNPAKITEYPEEAIAGEPFVITWETSNSTTGQTRLQYGQTPYPRVDYTGATSLKPVSGGGLQEHNTTIILNETGTWYFLPYINSTIPPFNYYGKNISIVVKPRIQVTSIPMNATAGEQITVEWNIFGPSSVESTNLRISNNPNPMSDPGGTGTVIQSGGAGTYSAQLTFNEVGIYYFTAHGQVDRLGEDHFSDVVSIKILPNLTIIVLPSPNNASYEFTVNWSIRGAYYIDRTYLEYSQNASFAENVFSTVSQYGYLQDFHQTVAVYTKGTWYFRVIASVNGIKEVYYSKEPANTTQIDPFSEINPSYPQEVYAGNSFKLYWLVFGFNSTVDKTQIFYDNDTNVFDEPLGQTVAKSGNTTEYSDSFTINEAGRYYFQANFSIDGDSKSWNSSIISIDVLPSFSIDNFPPNATGFTTFNISYSITGLDVNTTLVDLWYGEIFNISLMNSLITDTSGGLITASLPVTGLFYFAINLTFLGRVFWSSMFSIQIVPHIEVLIPWEHFADTNPDLSPGQWAIAGIPVTITWVVRNTTVVNLTDLHFNPDSYFEPEMVPIGGDYFKYDFNDYKIVAGLITPEQSSSGPTTHVFSQNVTFYVKEFKWIPFRVHAQCDDKLYDYYANASGIPVYPAAEAIHYNYTVVVDKQDIELNPINFSVTWGLGYELHKWNSSFWNNTPNFPGIVPNKVIGYKHANIHYMLNYDPTCPCILNSNIPVNNTPVRTGSAYPAIFSDNITISSVGTYYFRIHVKYNYSSTNENFTYPQHINRSYWSPLYKINVIYYGKYNTTVQAPILTPPPAVSYADYDADGDLDMLVANNSQDANAMRIITLYFNDGTGNYTNLPPNQVLSYSASPTGEEITSITAGHFDIDPHLDFIMTNESMPGSTVKGYVYLGDGTGNFVYHVPAFDSDSSQDASVYLIADYSGDGIDDFIYYGYSDFRLYYDLGMPGGDHISDGYEDPPAIPETLELTDLDGSPIPDLVMGLIDDSYAVEAEFPGGTITTVNNISSTFSSTNYPIIADFNYDGVNDSIVVNTTGEVILTVNITTIPVQRVVSYAIEVPQGITVGDFEDDGDLDIVIGLTADRFQFFFSNYSIDPTQWPGFSTQVVQNGGNVLAVGDFNNDSFLDISAYRADQYILHFLYGYIPPPSITNMIVSYNSTLQEIDIENIDVAGVNGEPINDTNAYFYWYTILDSNFTVVSELANLTWTGADWEALDVNVSYLPEGNYYVNTTFGDKYTFGNNSHALTLSTLFTVDHHNEIYVVFVQTLGGHYRTFNITVDIVNSTYTTLGNITGMEASIHSYTIRNATGHNVEARNATLIGNFTWGNNTGSYRWEAINVSTAYLLPGDYFVTVNFTDYLGYDNVVANSSLFTVNHSLTSVSTPIVTYKGNLTQLIEIRNVNIESSYAPFRVVGKGRTRNYTYYIFDNVTHTFTGVTGDMSWSGTSWYADVSVSGLPEGNYYVNAFFKDKFNATVTTVNSSAFTIKHTLDLSRLDVLYTGLIVQEFNVTIRPESTWDLRGILNNTEALTKSYALYAHNGSTPLEAGNLTWNGYLWTKLIDVSQLLEDDYFVQITFADNYANLTQNSSLTSVYHYIGVTTPDFLFNATTLELIIDNITATSTYHGLVNDTSVLPTIHNFTIFGNSVGGNITGSLNYSSPWHQSGINLSALMYSSTFTVRIVFEVNESFGSSEFEFWIAPQMAPTLNPISPNPDDNILIFLNWDDVNGTTYYYIYRDTSPITSITGKTPIARVMLSEYQDTVPGDGTYHYVIVAGNPGGNTSISNCQNVVVELPAGGIPGFSLAFLLIGVVSIIIVYLRKKPSPLLRG